MGRFRSNSNRTFVEQSDLEFESTEEALRPDKGNEADFDVTSNPFAFAPGQLNKLLNPKSLSAFKALGGLSGLERGLRTSLTAGLSVDEEILSGTVSFDDATQELNKASTDSKVFEDVPINRDGPSTTPESKGKFHDRLRVFRDNRLPKKKTDNIWKLIWKTYNDKILILLTIAAVISLSLGLYETFSGGSSVDWVEGVAICVAIIIVVVVGAANDYQKERQFKKLNERKDDRVVKAIRSGKSVEILVHDVTAGDVLHLEPGDAVPADGIFIAGHGVKCDESSATGESDQMKKTSGAEVQQRLLDGTATKKLDPFIISGSKVLEGVGTYLVTSVGQNSSYGKILMSLQTESEDTPLQVKLGKLANWIGGLGSGAAALLFFILLFRFVANLSSNPATPAVKGQEFLDILIVAITVIVVAVPEGLPLAVTLALAFATTRMLKENNLVRVLRACETMGNATTICSDKTGTLTQNKMTVVAGTLGIDEKMTLDAESSLAGGKESSTFTKAFKMLSADTQHLLLKSIALNSTAFEGEYKGVATFIGSKTETALLSLAKDFLSLESLATERANAEIVQLIPFDSSRKCMGAVVKSDGRYRLLVKGAAEIMLAQATQTISSIYDDDVDVSPLTPEGKEELSTTIDDYAKHSLRTIGLLYKDFQQWPPALGKSLEEDASMVDFDSIFHNMTWIGVVGIHDPLRPGVIEAVAQCQQSGVVVRMVTGDNLTTASAIANDCGILTSNTDIVMEGPRFRQLSEQEMDALLPHLRVLARSSPEDKRLLVARLKHLGETVAVTGDGTNDGPALKTADVGFSMGIAGTEVAKEASSIILLDDNFSSTITALMWGRAVNDAVKKFLQFQVTVNITAVILTFVSAVSNAENHSVLTAVQLLWVNLIMDTLAALALATDAPTRKILNRPPEKKAAPLITVNMWKMITGQAIYQLIVTFTLYFAGMSIFSYGPERKQELNTMVFNTFVWMQIFNEFNNRRLDNKFNIFEGVLKNYWFCGINVIMVAGQIMIVFIGGKAFGITRIDGAQWAVCILCALPCLAWAVVLRCVPDAWYGVVHEAVTRAVGMVLRPIGKGLHVVFHPVAQGWRALSRAIKRTTKRMMGKKTGVEEVQADEEAAPATPVGKVVEREDMRSPVSPPPIIFTTAPPA
jgi:Ca2+-transporting ATPase